MVAAQSDQLFADGTASISLPLALLGVTHHPLHLVAAGQTTVGVSTLTGVNQRLDAALDGQFSRLLRVGGGSGLTAASVQVEPELLHLVGVAVLLVAGHTQVEVVADRAVVAGLDGLDAGVAVVDELVLALGGK